MTMNYDELWDDVVLETAAVFLLLDVAKRH